MPSQGLSSLQNLGFEEPSKLNFSQVSVIEHFPAETVPLSSQVDANHVSKDHCSNKQKEDSLVAGSFQSAKYIHKLMENSENFQEIPDKNDVSHSFDNFISQSNNHSKG